MLSSGVAYVCFALCGEHHQGQKVWVNAGTPSINGIMNLASRCYPSFGHRWFFCSRAVCLAYQEGLTDNTHTFSKKAEVFRMVQSIG